MIHHSSIAKKYYPPLIGTALAAASLFHFALPAFAVGTAAGLELNNKATATYEDPDGRGFEVISNEVTVTVGKIAGITNVPSGFVDNTDNGSILPGDSIGFNFEVTNTGNDATDIYIPDAAILNANAVGVSIDPNVATSVRYSIDGGTTFINRPPDGLTTAPVAANDSIIVQVTGTVNNDVNQGDSISVRLGDTGNNTADTNSPDFPGTQNQPDDGAANDPQDQDVRTESINTASGNTPAVGGEPVNGEREASATNVLTVGTNPLALTRIRKTNAGFTAGADPDTLSDNVITYNLELDVLSQELARYNNFSFSPTALEGRDYTAAGTGTFAGAGLPANLNNLVLISDAIPANTSLPKATADANVAAPTGWTKVYTDDALSIPPDEATWDTDPEAAALTGDITRVGWIYDANTDKITAGETPVTGFSFNVVTSDLTDTATSIYNIAQVYGSTDDGVANSATGRITFDESGDENPNNFNDDGTFGPDETVADGGNFGVANPGTNEDNVDVDNDNTALNSPAGEVNRVRVTLAAEASDIFNGPVGFANATGGIFNTDPADDNHDFQNIGVDTPDINPANNTQDLANYNPAPITFSNTVQNPATQPIDDVILQPISPEELGLGGDESQFIGTGSNDDNSLRVTITYNGNTATYAYDDDKDGADDGGFVLVDGTPIVIPSIGGGGSISYDVQVDLPLRTRLSTEDRSPTDDTPVGGYAVPIAAYVDNGTNNATATGIPPSTTYVTNTSTPGSPTNGLDTGDLYNVTVNQVYTGYLKMLKEARVLRANDAGQYSLVSGMDFTDPDTAKLPAPGDRIEYRITYTNISEDLGGGTNSAVLPANDVRITEDGTTGGNNWALDGADDDDTIMDTLHVPNSAQDPDSSSIQYFSGDPSNTASTTTDREVTRYVDRIDNVEPGDSGTFTFQRKVTDESDIEELSATP